MNDATHTCHMSVFCALRLDLWILEMFARALACGYYLQAMHLHNPARYSTSEPLTFRTAFTHLTECICPVRGALCMTRRLLHYCCLVFFFPFFFPSLSSKGRPAFIIDSEQVSIASGGRFNNSAVMSQATRTQRLTHAPGHLSCPCLAPFVACRRVVNHPVASCATPPRSKRHLSAARKTTG